MVEVAVWVEEEWAGALMLDPEGPAFALNAVTSLHI